jgi:hypothetical protein
VESTDREPGLSIESVKPAFDVERINGCVSIVCRTSLETRTRVVPQPTQGNPLNCKRRLRSTSRWSPNRSFANSIGGLVRSAGKPLVPARNRVRRGALAIMAVIVVTLAREDPCAVDAPRTEGRRTPLLYPCDRVECRQSCHRNRAQATRGCSPALVCRAFAVELPPDMQNETPANADPLRLLGRR